MELYEYAVIFHPTQTKDQAERGEDPTPELVVDVTRCIAANAEQAKLIAARAIPEKYTVDMRAIQVLVRPFVRL